MKQWKIVQLVLTLQNLLEFVSVIAFKQLCKTISHWWSIKLNFCLLYDKGYHDLNAQLYLVWDQIVPGIL